MYVRLKIWMRDIISGVLPEMQVAYVHYLQFVCCLYLKETSGQFVDFPIWKYIWINHSWVQIIKTLLSLGRKINWCFQNS